MTEPIFTAQRTSSQIPERNERCTHSFFIRSAKNSAVRLFRVKWVFNGLHLSLLIVVGLACLAANHTVIWRRFHVQGLLYQPIEQLAPRTGFSAIESKREFIQVIIQMVPTDRPLVSSQQPAFEQSRDPMNPRKQLDGSILTLSTQNRNFMMVSIFLQAAVPLPSIGMHDTARFNGSSDKLLQTSCGGIRNARHADPSNATTILLRRNGNQRLSQDLACMRFGLFATNIPLLALDPSAPPIPARPNHRPSQFVQPRPGGQVAAQAQHPLQPHRAGSILLASHIPHGSEPQAAR